MGNGGLIAPGYSELSAVFASIYHAFLRQSMFGADFKNNYTILDQFSLTGEGDFPILQKWAALVTGTINLERRQRDDVPVRNLDSKRSYSFRVYCSYNLLLA